MKTAVVSNLPTNPSRHVLLSSFSPSAPKTRSQLSSIVLKADTDAKRQHAAIKKLIKMCQTSPVVSSASKGITAEVRKDRDHGHE